MAMKGEETFRKGEYSIVSIPRTGFMAMKDCPLEPPLGEAGIGKIDGSDLTIAFQPLAHKHKVKAKTLSVLNYRGSSNLTGPPGF